MKRLMQVQFSSTLHLLTPQLVFPHWIWNGPLHGCPWQCSSFWGCFVAHSPCLSLKRLAPLPDCDPHCCKIPQCCLILLSSPPLITFEVMCCCGQPCLVIQIQKFWMKIVCFYLHFSFFSFWCCSFVCKCLFSIVWSNQTELIINFELFPINFCFCN